MKRWVESRLVNFSFRLPLCSIYINSIMQSAWPASTELSKHVFNNITRNRINRKKLLKKYILYVNLRRQQLKAGVGKHPGIVEGSGAMFGQVLLPQVAGEADDPGILALRDVGKHPDVGGTHHIKLVTDGRGTPLC